MFKTNGLKNRDSSRIKEYPAFYFKGRNDTIAQFSGDICKNSFKLMWPKGKGFLICVNISESKSYVLVSCSTAIEFFQYI